MSNGFVNPYQITKYQTNKSLLEFNDHLAIADAASASQMHSPYSKINVVAIDYSQGKKEQAIVSDLNVDPDTMKYLAEEVLRGVQVDFTEQKILAHKKHPEDETKSKVTIFSVKYNEKMRYPWNIVVENGWGIAEKQETGGIALAKGTYEREKSVKIFINDMDFKKMMIQVCDYIRAFEISNFSLLMQKRDAFEKEQMSVVTKNFQLSRQAG